MSRKETTGRGLNADEIFVGLVDHGLFAEKMPPCFTSNGLSNHVSRSIEGLLAEIDDKELRNLADKANHDFIRYASLRDTNVPRHLGIPHPQSHIAQCLVIKRAWSEIKKHCAKPKRQVSRIFVRKITGERVFEMTYEGDFLEIATIENGVFRMNFKGAEQFEIEEEEIQFMTGAQYVVRADISTCFHSIYTHSIPWALHDKQTAKRNRSLALSGNLLDKVTQNTRDGQTNGLLIGPHASNVIAEIILTRVDQTLLNKGYLRLGRHIDDYVFYASYHEEAENFIHELAMALREYELSLNEKKTRILPMPRPMTENWVRELNAFQFPPESEQIRFSTIRSLLDLSLQLAHEAGTSATINYAIKMVPDRLSDRAKRLFVLEAINLAISYPYLASILDEFVFSKHLFNGLKNVIGKFADELLGIGLQRIYPDAICHSLFLALKYDLNLAHSEESLRKIIDIDDCLADVLLLEYGNRHGLNALVTAVRNRAANLKTFESREQDRFWLLIYQVWSEADLRGKGQNFLANLKREGFQFIRFAP